MNTLPNLLFLLDISSFVTTFRAFVKLPQTATDEPEAQIVSLKVIKHKQYLTVLTIHTHTPDTPMCDNIDSRQSTKQLAAGVWAALIGVTVLLGSLLLRIDLLYLLQKTLHY